jgi:6-methylsalicylate decarboxylase
MVSTPPYQGKFTREIVEGEIKRFHYDTAQVTQVGTLGALAKLVPGTDFPYRTAADHSKGVTALFSGEDLRKVERENALRLIPRLQTA